MNPYPRAALYARASGSDDPEDQLVPLRARCLKESWERVNEYVDSGRETSQRQQMIADARSRQIDVVVFHSLRKFCEDGFTSTISLLDELAGAGVEWLSLLEEKLTSYIELRRLLLLTGKKGEICHNIKSRL